MAEDTNDTGIMGKIGEGLGFNMGEEPGEVETARVELGETEGDSTLPSPPKSEQPKAPELPKSGSSGAELNQLMSELAFKEMGTEKAKWLKGTVKLDTVKYGNVNTAKQIIFTKGNMADIFRGNTLMRTAPFIMKTDIESKHSWAEFESHAFYGKNPPPWYLPWERAKIKLVLVGINKNSEYCDKLNGEGYKIKVDENAIAQLPMYARYTKEQLDDLMEDGRHNSQVHILWRKITNLEKDKNNWMFIGIIIVIILVIVGIAGFLILFPNAFAGIGTWFSHATSSLMPPGTPTHST